MPLTGQAVRLAAVKRHRPTLTLLSATLAGFALTGCQPSGAPEDTAAAPAETKPAPPQPTVTVTEPKPPQEEPKPKHTNRLANEASPYLQQHQHNPVDWYAWGEEAFKKARDENKPIFLSIGYSTCHWCHVMERESFEDEATAKVMNEHFVSIKLDREERPDVDKIYMTFVQLTTGSGGWPLNVWLTPDLKPFYGGTYYPPESKFGRPSFTDVLSQLGAAWKTQRNEILASANDISQRIGESIALKAKANIKLDPLWLDKAVGQFKSQYDPRFGGFGNAPKFPRPSLPLMLLRHAHRTGDQDGIRMVLHTCDQMAAGGMYDQIGGGFHRYSTDGFWLVPHFEKMLYDNALLAWTYLEAYQVTGKEMYSDIVHGILNYVLREMTDEQGGFYSAQDAGEIGEEGIYYLWSKEELEQHLTTEEWALFEKVYGITESGNVEGGRNVLALQEEYNWKIKEHSLIESAHDKLMMARSQRSRSEERRVGKECRSRWSPYH